MVIMFNIITRMRGCMRARVCVYVRGIIYGCVRALCVRVRARQKKLIIMSGKIELN